MLQFSAKAMQMVHSQPEDIPKYSENTSQCGRQNAAGHRKGAPESAKPLY